MGGAVEGGIGDWDEVVTRYPYRKVRVDHLLSKELFIGLQLQSEPSVCGLPTVFDGGLVVE